MAKNGRKRRCLVCAKILTDKQLRRKAYFCSKECRHRAANIWRVTKKRVGKTTNNKGDGDVEV